MTDTRLTHYFIEINCVNDDFGWHYFWAQQGKENIAYKTLHTTFLPNISSLKAHLLRASG